MYLYQESKTRLCCFADEIIGEDITFLTHYWGVDERLMENVVHKHSFFEICYVMGGSGTYIEEEKTYALEQGVLFCTRPEKKHQILSNTGLEIIYVAFDVDEKRSTEYEIHRFRTMAKSDVFFLSQMNQSSVVMLWKTMLIPIPPSPGISSELLSPIGYILLKSFADLFMATAESKQLMKLDRSTLLNKAKVYIRENMTQPLSIDNVANYLNISERHLSRLFTSHIKESFTSYRRQERLREASRLLADTSTPIKQIAIDTGFSSVYYFTKTFSDYKGVPPAQYRKSIQNEQLGSTQHNERSE